MTYHEYLQSEDWQMLRQMVIDKQEGQCTHCGRDITEVHHITYPKKWSEDSMENLIGLCGQCHMKEHKVDKQAKEVKFASIWDYVLVKAAKGRVYKPEDISQCKYEEKSICRRNGKNSYECEFFEGFTPIKGEGYIICGCHNEEYDEEEDFSW